MKNVIFLLLSIMIFLIIPQPSYAKINFPDVPNNHWGKEDINYLVEKGVINGYPNGNFGPFNQVTRADAALMIVKALELDLIEGDSPFTDVPKNHYAYKAIATAASEGIINGLPDKRYLPSEPLTRGQMAIVLQQAFKLEGSKPIAFKDVSRESFYFSFIQAIASNNITVGYTDGTFRPDRTIQRVEFAAFLSRALEVEIPIKDITEHKYDFIEIDGKRYGYNYYDESSVIFPYLAPLYLVNIENEEFIATSSNLDINPVSGGLIRTHSGLFNLLQIIIGNYEITSSNNPYLDGNIQLLYSNNNWSTLDSDLTTSPLKIGYEKKYLSANQFIEDRWFEYNSKEFRVPTNYHSDSVVFLDENGIRFVNQNDFVISDNLLLSLHDLLSYWGIDKSIELKQDGDLKYIKIN